MNEVVIDMKDISKDYKLYENKMDRFKEAIFPTKKKYYKEFSALKSVSLEIRRGETIGLIGKNGSGKSTLLKILTGIITPTSGEVEVKGKISALLELGAGFNPEYTGLENIYLNATILGFSKKQIDDKLQEILDFADIGDFVNHPVKLYSSGMFVRLAYAVQACIDPEILIVDEALAVGDAAFSLKCMNHMKKLVNKGVTVILVTHDVQTIRSFCSRVIWLQHGKIIKEGMPSEVTSEYVKSLFLEEELEGTVKQKEKKKNELIRWGNQKVVIKNFNIVNEMGEYTDIFYWNEKISIKLMAEVIADDINYNSLGFAFSFRNKHGLDLIVSTTFDEGTTFESYPGQKLIEVQFKLDNILTPGDYFLVLSAEDRSSANPIYYDFIENAIIFKVIGDKRFFSLVQPKIEQSIDFK
ncbi:teichoic acid ABC transporter ATP-binding protein [Lysinibacillus piscis]|uniref:Teichoic acid ABC transporter ATP-binding protein n=2 Tax=Lysinibacillus piscis TaxID=2518931 RepID=A0ABQ5NHV5_9BACI|nr:teichoic acid ABC transporter ATP-binding protein [Lysinibacillus sp. KH24]